MKMKELVIQPFSHWWVSYDKYADNKKCVCGEKDVNKSD